MRGLFGLLIAMFVAAPALAEEAVAAPPDTGSPFWNFMGYVFAIILVPLLGLLGKLILAWQSKLAKEASKADLDFKEKLKAEAMLALSRIAENITNKQLTELKTAAIDGKVSKEELKNLGQQAIDQAKSEFKTQGIDLGKRLGQEFLESQLRNIVDKAVKK